MLTSLKGICDAYDKTYELEGKKLKKAVEELKISIEAKFANSTEMLENSITTTEYQWLAWIYGKVLNEFTSPEDILIMDIYGGVVERYDERAKKISNKHHYTNMYDVIECQDEF